MAPELAKKNKWSLVKKTLTESESHYQKIIDALVQSKKQGTSAPGDFILKVKLSNEKHREVIENLFKDAPSSDITFFEQILKTNKQISQKLAQL